MAHRNSRFQTSVFFCVPFVGILLFGVQGCVDLFEQPTERPPGAEPCRQGDVRACEPIGECQAIQTCTAQSTWGLCEAALEQSSEEVEDGRDNDCDGSVDEHLEGGEEICDGLDNDSDGSVDEGLLCISAEGDCNGVDDDEDGNIDEPFMNCEQDQYTTQQLIGQELHFEADSVFFNAPYGMVLRPNGEILFSAKHAVYVLTFEGKVFRIAGTNEGGFSGDGGLAINARLNNPQGLAFDREGNLYIADDKNNRVRKVDTRGIITTIAGTGAPGRSGDEGLAVNAMLNDPSGVAIGPEGDLYIADDGNHRIRKVDLSLQEPTIDIVIGGGDDLDEDDQGIAVENARLDYPGQITFGPNGALYIVEFGVIPRVRKVEGLLTENPEDDRITTVAREAVLDTGERVPLDQPWGIAFDAQGNLYVAGHRNYRVFKLSEGGELEEFVGNGEQGFSGDIGLATQARLNEPGGIVFDAQGNLLIADTKNHRLRKVALVDIEGEAQGIITTAAGTGQPFSYGDGGPALNAKLSATYGVVSDAEGNIFFAEDENHVIRKVDTEGVISTYAGTRTPGNQGDDGPAIAAQLNDPRGLAIDREGHLYVVDQGNHSIRKIDPLGTITTVAGTVEGYAGDNGVAAQAQLHDPHDVAIDEAGNLYIADEGNHVVRKINEQGIITTIAGIGMEAGPPEGVDENGDPISIIATQTHLNHPTAVDFFDAQGIQYLFVADAGNRRVHRINLSAAEPTIQVIAGNGLGGYGADGRTALSQPLSDIRDLIVERDGSVLIAMGGGHRVSRIDMENILNKVTGVGESPRGQEGFSGDGGLAMGAEGAKLSHPYGIFEHVNGQNEQKKLYISDAGNHRIRKIEKREVDGRLYDIITTVAGEIYPEGTDVLERGMIRGAGALSEGPFADGILTVSTLSRYLFSVFPAHGRVEVLAGYIDGFEDGTYPDVLDFPEWGNDENQQDNQDEKSLYVPATYGRLFHSPFDVVYDPDVQPAILYITEQQGHSIRKVILPNLQNTETWGMRTLIGHEGEAGLADGSFALAQFNQPSGMVLWTIPASEEKVLYVSDKGNGLIRVIYLTPEDKRVRTLLLQGAEGTSLIVPEHLEIDEQGRLIVTDVGDEGHAPQVFTITLNNDGSVGSLTPLFGTSENASDEFSSGMRAEDFFIEMPRGLAVKENGDVYVSAMHRIYRIEAGENGVAEPTDFVEVVYQADGQEPIPSALDSFARHTPQLLGDLYFDETGLLYAYEHIRGTVVLLSKG